MYIYIYILRYITKASRRPGLSIGISEAKLVWGVWGGRLWFGCVLGRWGRSLPGESSKKRGPTSLVFEGWKRSSILDTFGCFLTFFWRFSSGVKSQNTVIYIQCFWAFGMEKVLLATCWKLRKYHCFCKVPATKHCKYSGFWYQEQKPP